MSVDNSVKKLYIIDVSINSSEREVIDFIESICEGPLRAIAVFDNKYCVYTNTDELLDDLENDPDNFFQYPAAYFDCVIGILSHARKMSFDEIMVVSPEVDDCSILSNEDSFDNYIFHYQKNFGDIFFHDYESFSDFSFSRKKKKSTVSIFSRILSFLGS